MKLTRAVETIITEDDGASLQRRIVELDEVTGTLHRAMDNSTKDYNLVVAGNKKLGSQQDQLKHHCENLQAELAQVRSDTEKQVADLEARVKSAEARSIDAAAEGEKNLRDFKDGLVRKLEELGQLYADNVRTIEGLCSLMSVEEPSAEDYLRWLLEEAFGLPDMFSGVNENFATAMIEGALAMAGDSVDLDVVRVTASESGANVLPARPDVRRAVRAVSKKWWHSFSYNYVLSVICTKLA
jgi:hypothetical protein